MDQLDPLRIWGNGRPLRPWKPAFPLPLILEDLADGTRDHWRLYLPFAFLDGADTYIAPPAFANDLASIPRPLHGVIDPTNEVAPAAVIHDWLYATRGYIGPGRPNITRAKADAIFRRALAANGVGWYRRMSMWSAVRIGGASAWTEGVSPEALLTISIQRDILETIDSLDGYGTEATV